MRRQVLCGTSFTFCSFCTFLLFFNSPSFAATVTISPGDNVKSAVAALRAGDTLILSGGTYNTSNIVFNRDGTSSAWITMRAASGATVVLNNNASENLINIDGADYVRVMGLELKGGPNGTDAFKFKGTCRHVLIEDCYIHDVGGGGINCSSITRVEDLTVRRCEITRTGARGEGMYLGVNGGGGPVMNSLFEQNYIHHTGGDQGDGIEVNQGCKGNVIRDNVIHDTRYPCILIENSSSGAVNIVERNVCWNSSDNVLQVNGYALVRNNIIFNGAAAVNFSGSGIEAYNNVFRDGGRAVRFSTSSMKFANNIVDGPTHNTPSGTITNNWFSGAGKGNNVIPGAPGYNPGSMDFYATNTDYVNAGWSGDGDVPGDDFNGTARQNAPDIGPYELLSSSNPGWQIASEMKVLGAAPPPNQSPQAVASASPTTVSTGDQVAFSSVGSNDPDGSIASYGWNFGDGATGSGSSANHAYSSAGVYTATLTVTDDQGATDIDTVQVLVLGTDVAAPVLTLGDLDVRGRVSDPTVTAIVSGGRSFPVVSLSFTVDGAAQGSPGTFSLTSVGSPTNTSRSLGVFW